MSAFCQISGLILIAIENFWILPHFILCMSRVVKKVSCELNFWHKSKFLDFAKFHPSQVRSGQNLDCKPNFQCDWKYLDFAIFHPSQVWSGHKLSIWAWFLLRLKISEFYQLSSFTCPQFWAKFLTRIKISSLAGQGWSNSWFQVKFTKRLKISGLCQILSFAGLEWSKIYFLSQIFNTNQNFSRFCQISSFAGSEWSTLLFFSQICSVTENFWILPNFILCMSRVVKTLNFGLNFDCNWKFLNFTTFHPLHVQSGQKCQLWAKFLTRIKISWFCKISSFAGQEWSKSRLQAEFSARLKISGFCHMSSFAGLEWSKIWFLSQIFNTNQNFSGFCQIFILCWFRVGNTLIFEPNFQHDWKFLDCSKFLPLHVQSGQNYQFWA